MGLAHITVFRHADAAYAQGQVTLEESDDLTAKGRKTLDNILDTYLMQRAQGETFGFLSSPFGRTLDTAKSIRDKLAVAGFLCYDITPTEQLQEVQGLSWPTLEACIYGGKVDAKGQTITVDKRISNPKAIPYPDYYTTAAYLPIMTNLPSPVQDTLRQMESFAETTERMKQFLHEQLQQEYDYTHLIVTTHDSLVGPIAAAYSGQRVQGVRPGSYATMRVQGNELYIEELHDYQQQAPVKFA